MTGEVVALRQETGLGPHEQFEYDLRMARALAASGLFTYLEGYTKTPQTPEMILVKILVGRDLGMNPTQAAMGIHIIEGKPEVSAAALGARVNQLPNKRFAVVRHEAEACEIAWFAYVPGAEQVVVRWHHASDCPAAASRDRDAEGCNCNPAAEHEAETLLGVSRFDEADLERSGIKTKSNKGNDLNHVKYPKNMKFARALSWGQRTYAQEATLGIPTYVEGEIPREPQRFEADTGALDQTRSLHAIAQEFVPWELRDRFHEAWREAARVRRGMLTRAAAEMALSGLENDPGLVLDYIFEIERDNAAAVPQAPAEEPVDATVVPENLDGSDSTSAEAAQGSAPTQEGGTPMTERAPVQEPSSDINPEALRARLAELKASTPPADKVEMVDEEIAWIEAQLADAAAVQPGQGALL